MRHNVCVNKYFIIVAVLVFALVAVFIYANTAEAPTVDNTDEQPSQGRVMDIETYVRQNISQLSPEPAVLGGTFYVTSIEAADGRGRVEYEDGHIALVADFTYTINPDTGITITSFTIIQ